MKTKLFTLLLAVAASIGTMFASDTSVDGIWYNFDNSTLTAEVTYRGSYSGEYSNEYSGAVTIPSSITYNAATYSVTSIGNYAFYDCSGLTSLTIPNSVISIGWNAFDGCTGLTSVTIPNSVTDLGGYAFFGCDGLTYVEIGNSVTSIEMEAFCNCTGLISVTIPNSVTSIGDEAFYGCTSLTSVTIPNSVISIGYSAFNGCSSLTSVTIPNSVTSIGYEAFSGCSNLFSVTIPNSVTSIGEYAFRDVLNIVYNGTATGSPWGARNLNGFVDGWLLYSDNTKTTLLACSSAAVGEITIPSGVIRINERAFAGCSGISSIYIYHGVSYIGYHAFAGCSSLATISIPSSVKNLKPSDSDYWIYDNGEDELFDDDNSLSDPVYNLHTFFYLPKNYAGEYTLPQCVKFVATAITDCPNLTAIHIPEGVEIINGRNFSGCPNLNEITLPNSITRILANEDEGGPFYGSGYYSNENNWTTENGVKSLYIGTCLIDVKDFGTQKKWSIREGTTIIADGATTKAINYDPINSVTFPESLITIGNSIFAEMKLKSVTIPDNVRYIGNEAFGYNHSLISVIVGDGVEAIGRVAFAGCSNLKSLVLGSGIRRIGPEFIGGCSSLSTIICEATEVPDLYTWRWSKERGEVILEIMSASDFDEDYEGVSRQVSLYVPAEVIQDYQNHPVWGQFNVKPIHNADSASVDHLTLTETDDCSVRVEWPAVSNAETYELVITDQNGNVVCTYIFDSEGQLISIVFNAPNRDNSDDQMQSAGFSFSISGLEEGQSYVLTITSKDNNGNTLDQKSVSFTTGDEQGLEDINVNTKAHKILRNGQILILRGDRTYTLTGQEIK